MKYMTIRSLFCLKKCIFSKCLPGADVYFRYFRFVFGRSDMEKSIIYLLF